MQDLSAAPLKPASKSSTYDYEAVLAASLRNQWQIDDIISEDEQLDFSRNFLPENLARTASLPGLSEHECRTLNHIAAYQYVRQFEVVETFILPFMNNHVETSGEKNSACERALVNFIDEEKKHVETFQRFRRAFERGSSIKCLTLDSSNVAERILLHDPLAIGLIILMFEWATQSHYLDSIRSDGEIDPVFKRMFKFHWIEEAQHAKLDTLVVEALAAERSSAEIDRAVGEAIAIGATIDRNCRKQAELNILSLERAINRKLPNRGQLIQRQYGAGRYMLLSSGLKTRQFQDTLGSISPRGLAHINQVAFPPKQAAGNRMPISVNR